MDAMQADGAVPAGCEPKPPIVDDLKFVELKVK